MKIWFTDENFDIKNLTKGELSGTNQYLLDNNKKQLGNIYNFFSGKTPLMLVNGYIGTGKTQIINHSLKFLHKDTIVLEYNCFETTILDDVLLSFFEDFRELTVSEIISAPKIKSENFTQKIAAYFNTIEKPILIIINSLESVLKNNKQEILDFLFHIMQHQNVKVIIVSRKFNYDDFNDKIPYEKTTCLALDKGIFEKFLRSEGIKMIGPVSDELYKHTRGYFLYTYLTTKIINIHKLLLIDFIEGYTKSFLTYNDFILREALSLVEPASGHLFRLLTVLRHPISTKLLEKINMYNEERLKYFEDNLLICQEKNMIYLQDYYKEISLNSIPENVLVKLHKSCVELYSTQLPLKPFERDLLVSRQTMRSEIEYHTLFLPKRPALMRQIETAAIEAIEYAADTQADYSSIPTAENNLPPSDIEIETPHSKEEKIKKISFIFDTEEEEKEILDGIASSINKYIDYSNKILTPEETHLPFMELMNSANREEKNYNYKKALAFYQLALTLKDNENYPNMVSRIYTKSAKCYEKLSDWFNALKYYDTALTYYDAAGDYERINNIKYSIANIFYNTYKHEKAATILEELLARKENLSHELSIKSHILMAAIKNENIKEAYKHYKSAFALIDNSVNSKILAELYFMFATVCDDLDETETAIKLYQKCLDIKKENPYSASATTNLAIIFDDTGATNLSVKYYEESLIIDEENKNYTGIYETSIRLAKILKRNDINKANEYYKKALITARELNEPYYIMCANIEYGDFCVDRKIFSKALKFYIIALSRTKDKTLYDYKTKIEQRIRDLKIRLGNDEFKKLEDEIRNGQTKV